MKIRLISPALKTPRNIGRVFHLPQMSLALIAGLSPPDVNISITDELVQPIDFHEAADMVGITVNSKTAVRSYEISDEFRNRGVPVILGGIHPQVARYEAIKHADALVLGEIEDIWHQLLEDFRRGRLRSFYHSKEYPTLDKQNIPRRDLFQKNKYDTINLVQTSRGCPYACHFCSVSTHYGQGVRCRPVGHVIEEIKTLEGNIVFFVDDNVFGVRGYAEKLLAGLVPLKKKWIGQATVNVAHSEDTLRLLHASGCHGLFVGFETETIDSLKAVGKTHNLHCEYSEAIKRFHDHGISILGSFIVGFDSDDKSCFEKLLEFIVKSGIDVADISVLTPYPGTILYENMVKRKRMIDNQWWLKYEADDVVYMPKLMTREELYEGRIQLLRELYKIRPTLKRWAKGLGWRSIFGNLLAWKGNMGYRMNAYAAPGKSLTI